MKTSHSILMVGFMAASAGYAAPSAPPPSGPPGTAEKTHTLFMGVDISVEKDKKFHRVRDVSGSSWIINIDGRPEIIPTERKALSVKIEQSVKLTEATATFGNIVAERAYTSGNDPRMESMRTQIQMESYSTERVMAAEMELSRVSMSAAFSSMIDPLTPRLGPPPDPDKAAADLMRASEFASSGVTDRQFHQAIEEEQLKQENFDAIRVQFDVSSEKPLPNPYFVIVAQFHEKNAAPGVMRNWIYAQSIDPVDSTTRKIDLLKGGLPRGYVLGKVEVHLYDRGREVATNVSPKRVPLTRDEAFEYIVIEHIAGNKGATLAPTPVMVALPAELWTRLAAGQGQQVYYVKVSKDGLVDEAYENPEYTQKIQDPFFAEAVRKIWFKPALEKGKPVEARTKVDVTKLRI